MSRVMKKPAFYICQNKGAAADQSLCFRRVDSATKPENSSLNLFSVVVQPGMYRTWSGIFSYNKIIFIYNYEQYLIISKTNEFTNLHVWSNFRGISSERISN